MPKIIKSISNLPSKIYRSKKKQFNLVFSLVSALIVGGISVIWGLITICKQYNVSLEILLHKIEHATLGLMILSTLTVGLIYHYFTTTSQKIKNYSYLTLADREVLSNLKGFSKFSAHAARMIHSYLFWFVFTISCITVSSLTLKYIDKIHSLDIAPDGSTLSPETYNYILVIFIPVSAFIIPPILRYSFKLKTSETMNDNELCYYFFGMLIYGLSILKYMYAHLEPTNGIECFLYIILTIFVTGGVIFFTVDTRNINNHSKHLSLLTNSVAIAIFIVPAMSIVLFMYFSSALIVSGTNIEIYKENDLIKKQSLLLDRVNYFVAYDRDLKYSKVYQKSTYDWQPVPTKKSEAKN